MNITNIITGSLITFIATNYQPVSVIRALPERADGVGDVYYEIAPIVTNTFVQFTYTNHTGKVITWKHEMDFEQSTNMMARYRTNEAPAIFRIQAPKGLHPLPESTTIVPPPLP